ncbi:MAG: HAD-IIIC family phosphatase [Eubacteriales bacterium]|nr:HAD-IIIC family phosphatase [Eubacteriales bacterium]
MKELEYPFDAAAILKKKKQLRKALIADGTKRIERKIAVLGASTTHDIRLILELFLLNFGIEPVFYECEYGKYWEDVMFDAPELKEFAPDLVYIHTSFRSIPETSLPLLTDSEEAIQEKLSAQFAHYRMMWDRLLGEYGCEIIQDNFEKPYYRLLGNLDSGDVHGRTSFVLRLNELFSEYARTHERFHINDAEWLSSDYGLSEWSSPVYWNMYKYCPAVPAIPYLSYSIASVIKSIYGKNKKALVLDLDNTLWGGIVGDDGPENIEIGMENGIAEMYTEFQKYLKAHKDMGILLTVDSKNEEENAIAGLSRADSVLKPEDFLVIKANWEPKDRNAAEIAAELNIGTDALVFVDDNPAERHIVREQLPGIAVPEMTEGQESAPERYIRILDRSAFFEPVKLSADDLKRGEMYRENLERHKAEASFTDYGEYLRSLSMQAEIAPFAPMYMSRIAQLTNKSNQFNLTTKRCTQAEIEAMAADQNWITLYGKLSDRFGDNGVVSVVAGHLEETGPACACETGAEGVERVTQQAGKALHIDLWLMSCRVLKRGMENAMLDALVDACLKKQAETIFGYYYPTQKNGMVRDFYDRMGFTLLSEDAEGNRRYALSVGQYVKGNDVIAVSQGNNTGV